MALLAKAFGAKEKADISSALKKSRNSWSRSPESSSPATEHSFASVLSSALPGVDGVLQLGVVQILRLVTQLFLFFQPVMQQAAASPPVLNQFYRLHQTINIISSRMQTQRFDPRLISTIFRALSLLPGIIPKKIHLPAILLYLPIQPAVLRFLPDRNWKKRKKVLPFNR